MSIFKDVTQTVKNIFNADDDMIFDDEAEFKEQDKGQNPFPKIPFGKQKSGDKPYQINNGVNKMPSFDMGSHGFDMAQSGITRKGRSNGRIQVYVPKTFEESFNIIKDVKSGFTAMVNVEVANPQISQRIVDVISGAIYALDGECKKMGEKQYIFSLSAETIGAYDYLPVNGVPVMPDQNTNYNMNQPFNFLNQGANQQSTQQQTMQQGFAQSSFPQANFNTQNNQPDYSKFYQPPQSQF